MRDLTPSNFGLVVAYLIPGFVVLWALGYHNSTIREWLAASPESAPTVGGLLYATLASIAAGMVVSSFRFVVIDSLHHRTGVAIPAWDFSQLHDRLAAFETLIEIHYRYYQSHANMFVAIIFAYIAWRLEPGRPLFQLGIPDALFISVECMLFLASRDALGKYYLRTGALLTTSTQEHSHEQRRTETPRNQDGSSAQAAGSGNQGGSAEIPAEERREVTSALPAASSAR